MSFPTDKDCRLQNLYNQLPPDVKGHSLRVSLYLQIFMAALLRIAPEIYPRMDLQTDDQIIAFARECGFYHDIGKIKVPKNILYKHGSLTKEEYEIVKEHPLMVSELLSPYLPLENHEGRRVLSGIIQVGSTHHERWDGTGYPAGLKGAQIPLLGRMCALADTYDAMTSRRSYSSGSSHAKALREIERCSGTQFDPELDKIFLSCGPELQALLENKTAVPGSAKPEK